jgi:hypothetical protein
MRKLLIALLAAQLTACGSLPELPCPGTRSYDVQYCRGERPRAPLGNFPFEAQQRARKCDQCIDIENNCYHGVPPECRPKWQGNR